MVKGSAVKRPRKDSAKGLKQKVEKALGGSGNGDIWIRESDGAVCIGDECIVLTSRPSGGIDIQVDSGACGSAYREKLVDKLVKGAGKGVNIRIRSGKSGKEDD